MELKDKVEELGKAIHDFKALNDAALKDVQAKGQAAADKLAQVDRANDEITKLQTELKAMQTAMARHSQGAEDDRKDKKSAHAQAFEAFARKGKMPTAEEFKTMSVDSDIDGGFLVTPEMSTEIVKKVFESSPMRQLASVQTISTDSLEIIQDLQELASGWVGETQARPNTGTPQINKISIAVHELYASPLITQKLLDDAAWNMESYLSEKVSEKFARDEATAFVSGDGVMKPKGILSYAAGTAYGEVEQVNSGSAAALTPDGLINLSYALKGDYKKNASWLMKRATVKSVRKFKDTQNRYLWEPGLNGKTQDSILGFPIYEANDMQDEAANALAVAFGDFKQGYQIVDRIGIRVLRDAYTAKPYVMFYTTKRVGGAVKNFEAIKLQKCST